ncbi:cellulose biosynthesis protein BcsQ [Chryseobacterium ginsenosidimutans]|uniref:ParA family protein n=1 Tax=Chryseobacterium ginsenosidimutans TaxID=687846 RepID=UPI0027833ADC|nr:ParA family protein [Chryseobacterium ginsenosidimutans]MDQ0594935.1 cellulose biosynthesis protein BcsQ [Chryseobacterium ginsenosidimutans]
METKKQPVIIAFSTQKGGVGKSTFTALVASILHYRLGYNIAVFDCDFPQYSLIQMRERDLKTVMQNEALKKMAHRQFTNLNKKAYPIFQSKADTVLEEMQDYNNNSETAPDVIFLDLPGTVNTAGILRTLASVHYIFSPITADRVVLESTLSFTDVLTNVLMKEKQTAIKSIQLFWNQVDGREKTLLYENYSKVIKDLGLQLMETSISDSKRFRKEGETVAKTVFRSSLLPADPKLMTLCRLDSFVEEFLKIVNL